APGGHDRVGRRVVVIGARSDPAACAPSPADKKNFSGYRQRHDSVPPAGPPWGNALKLPRRTFLQMAAGAAALAAKSRVARSQSYPTRPVHWIGSFTAGGPNDTVARIIGQYLSERLGQQFIIENKVGAGGNIGMAAVLSSPPDGYTIGFVAPNNAINATLYDKLPFDFVRDSVPVAGTMLLTNVMVVHP